jgi:hypothetical protein
LTTLGDVYGGVARCLSFLVARLSRGIILSSLILMYIGENFNVRFHDIFRFWKLLENNSSCGILHSEFIPNKNFRNMMISRSAQKIRDVPNAGGNNPSLFKTKRGI